MAKEHPCEQDWRISSLETALNLTSEYMQKQFDDLKSTVKEWFDKAYDKIDDIVIHSDATYAKRAELDVLTARLNADVADKKEVKLNWIKNWWVILVAAVSWVFSLLSLLFK